ncbi:MAG TPA: ABC transporter transmembrane domain-containing protein, partial [Acidimicrobiales bacterium]|nr:ABC transporter transmembrane domain-containing protein [Acidimicrobiales bacterium]
MHRFMRYDPASLRDAHIDRRSLRRAWAYARPYRAKLIAYLGIIILTSGVAVLPPLVFKRLIDHDLIPALGNHTLRSRALGDVTLLFGVAVFLALAQTGLNLVGRWYSAYIGEGLIFDMRTRLYEHVQRMPMAFFTRVQTGSLLSRLSNDVLGAQQTVGTLSSVVSDVFSLATVVGVMIFLSWQVTIATLIVVPLFIVLDRKLGQRLAALSRTQMTANASMSTTMTERFNVSGAQIVKLFGRPKREAAEFRERAAAVRDAGIDIAMTGRI